MDTQEQALTMPVDHEKNVHYQGVMISIPTFGKVSAGFLYSEKTMGAPIFANVGLHIIQGKPVDVARCEFADIAMKNKMGFVLFRDDDTIAPQDALIKLLERFPHKQKSNPQEADMIVGGVVYSKSQPPVPMVHINGHTAGFEDWNPGDFFEVDAIGMGCTLIPVGAFLKLLPHITKYRCKNDICPEPWGEYDKQEVETQVCPRCGDFLVPGFFKTVRCGDHSGDWDIPMLCTEDAYFCMLAKKKAGVRTFVDTGVLCEHEVFHPSQRQTVYYGYYQGIGPGWRVLDKVFFYPDLDHKEFNDHTFGTIASKSEKNEDVKFNLGAGGVNLPGYINLDLTTDCEFKCDVRDLAEAVKKYGRPKEILASHLLEHISPNETLGVVRNWLKYLQPGGLLQIDVPDGVVAMQKALAAATEEGAMNFWPETVVFGAQRWPGDEHRTIFYRKKFDVILAACSNQIESYTITDIPEGTTIQDSKGMVTNQNVLCVKIIKKSVEVRDEAENVPVVSSDTTALPEFVPGN